MKTLYKNIMKLSSMLILVILIQFSPLEALGSFLPKDDTLSIMKLKQYERTKARAAKYYNDYAYSKGITVYKKALEMLPSDDTLKLHIASGYYQVHNLDSADQWYAKVIDKESIIDDDLHYLNYAEVLTTQGRYIEAKKWFQRYANGHPGEKRVNDRLAGLESILEFYKDSIRFEIWHESFNSDTYDFSPSYYEDDILFVSGRETTKTTQFLKPKYKLDKTYFLNLFEVDSALNVNVFEKRIKSSYHEGPVTFYDNDTKVIFTRNNFTKAELRFQHSKLHVQGAKVTESKEGINKLKLFYAEKSANGQWNTPVELWFNSDEYSTGHPTVSKDGNRLYFASDREGGHGETDIYRSIWYSDVWGEPENLGNIINTEGSEMFPFVDENEVLYYASSGHEGLGGLDIFKVDLNRIEAKPENMGYPMNSPYDDFGLIAKDHGTHQSGYFSSNRIGGLGLDDIYAFNFEKQRSLPGKVVDLLTGNPVSEAHVAMINQDGDTTGYLQTQADGLFDFKYTWGEDYFANARKPSFSEDDLSFNTSDYAAGDTIILRITKELLIIRGTMTDKLKGDTLDAVRIIVLNESTGYKFGIKTLDDGAYSFIGQPNTKYSFSLKKHKYFSEKNILQTDDRKSGEVIHDGQLEEIVIGKPMKLKDIHFDLAKWNIREDASIELDKFTNQLEDNPSIIVELSTHTDCRGSDPYNLDLSDKRAKSSAKYVIDHGIPNERLVGKGYGETKLLNKCDDGVRCTADEHQVNRRAEFMVTGFLPFTESEEEKSLFWIEPDYITASLLKQANEKLVLVDGGKEGQISLSGFVMEENGRPVGNVLISIMEKGINKASQVYSSANGHFELKVKAGKTYRLVAQIDGYLEEGIEVEVKDQALEKLNFELVKN